MTDQEMLSKIKAREELEQRGYKRVTCDHCKGKGYLIDADERGRVYGIEAPCRVCDGKGFRWEGPVVR